MPPLEIETRAEGPETSIMHQPAPRRRQHSTVIQSTVAASGTIAGQSFDDTHEKDAGSEAAKIVEATKPTKPPRNLSRRKPGAADQTLRDTHTLAVSGELIADQSQPGLLDRSVRKRRGQSSTGAQIETAPPQALRETYRKRQDILQAETALTLRIRAVCRRLLSGDKDAADKLYDAMFGKGDHADAAPALAHCEPLILARGTLIEARKKLDKALEKLAKQHRLWPWAEGIRGLGPLSFGQLMGELGVDPGEYRGPAAIWKRMGLAVIDGGRQRRIAGADEALKHGYSPKRRSLMFIIGDNMIRAGNVEFRALYLERKAIEAAKMPEGTSKLHIHRRAKRYCEKRLLRDLWRAARPNSLSDPITTRLAANPSGTATSGEAPPKEHASQLPEPNADARAIPDAAAKELTPASSATNSEAGAKRQAAPTKGNRPTSEPNTSGGATLRVMPSPAPPRSLVPA